MSKKNQLKRYIFIIVIVLIVAIAAFIIIMFKGNYNNIIAKDPATIALTQTDVFNIPQGLIYNSSLSEQTYKVGNYWNATAAQAEFARGFTNGYFDDFVYQDSGANNIKVIGSSISMYNNSAQNILNEDIQGYDQTYGCIPFNLPTIGDYSYGCHMVTNISNYVMSYYEVFFYKNNVAVRTWVGQNQLVDLSSDVVPYANTIASRI
jgi:hypothetical protein